MYPFVAFAISMLLLMYDVQHYGAIFHHMNLVYVMFRYHRSLKKNKDDFKQNDQI